MQGTASAMGCGTDLALCTTMRLALQPPSSWSMMHDRRVLTVFDFQATMSFIDKYDRG